MRGSTSVRRGIRAFRKGAYIDMEDARRCEGRYRWQVPPRVPGAVGVDGELMFHVKRCGLPWSESLNPKGYQCISSHCTVNDILGRRVPGFPSR
jgi:hypothetical protein